MNIDHKIPSTNTFLYTWSALVAADAVWVTVSLAMIGKFGIAASFAVFYVFVGELLPTVLRSQAMGIASFIAGIGLLTFPYIVHLAVYSRVLPLIVMGSLSVAGAITSIFLPETLNIHLPQTVEEGELFGADFKLWSCPTIPKLVISLTKDLAYCKMQSRILFSRKITFFDKQFLSNLCFITSSSILFLNHYSISF